MYKAFETYTLGEETEGEVEKIALNEKLNIPWGNISVGVGGRRVIASRRRNSRGENCGGAAEYAEIYSL